jgi:RNA polymerase sigma-70 factor (ECF subfamily)
MGTGKPDDEARRGGIVLDRAFAELRPTMFALAYRITGSRADAEDIVQDAFVRLHGAQPEEAVRSLKAYLATITARLSLNRLRDQKARRETYIGEWLPEPIVTDDDPAVHAEDISFALLVVLERLSAVERVVFVLRSAFDLPFEEIAAVVARDAVSCRKIFSRARTRVMTERPRFTIDRARHRAVMRSFIEATQYGDVASLAALLDDNIVLHGDGGGKALANKRPVVGSVAVARFVIALTQTLPADTVLEEILLNGAPAFIVAKSGGQVVVAVIIETDGNRIQTVFAIANPDKLEAIRWPAVS